MDGRLYAAPASRSCRRGFFFALSAKTPQPCARVLASSTWMNFDHWLEGATYEGQNPAVLSRGIKVTAERRSLGPSFELRTGGRFCAHAPHTTRLGVAAFLRWRAQSRPTERLFCAIGTRFAMPLGANTGTLPIGSQSATKSKRRRAIIRGGPACRVGLAPLDAAF